MKLEIISREPAGEARATPLVFVHGAWHGAWCWEENFLAYFALHGYRSFALSFRGHGNSEGRERLGGFSLNDYVADVTQVAGQLESLPVLVGHSTGGMVVQKYLEKHRAAGAVLLASVPVTGGMASGLRLARRHPLLFLKSQLTMSMYPLIGSTRLAQEAFFSASMPEEQVARYFARMQDESFRVNFELGFCHARPVPGKTPLLVLGAGEDNLFTVKEIEATAQAYGVKAEIIPGMAHDMMLEAGWRTVAERIVNWLERQQADLASASIKTV